VKSGKLTRIEAGKKAGKLRTDSMDGVFQYLPTEGEGFDFFGEPLTPGAGVRTIMTSPICVVEEVPGGYRFTTATGSTYQLDVLPENKA